MKKIILILLWCTTLFGLESSGQLPQESVDLIDSFGCFSKEDKKVLKSYLLLLDYRIGHVDDPDVFDKTDKDYWKLYDVINDIGDKCNLVYNYDDYLENTIIDTKQKQNQFSKLRRIEGRTHYTREKYDSNDSSLIEQIVKNTPKFSVIPSKPKENKYKLSTLKNYKDRTIPKKIYDGIVSKKLTKKQKNVLMKIAYLNELKIHLYDQVDRLKAVDKELKYLAQCQDYYHTPRIQTLLRGNSKRELALNIQDSHTPSNSSILPNDALKYCENNVTDLNLSTFVVQSDPVKVVVAPKIKIELTNLKKYLKRYDKDPKKKKYADRYLQIVKKSLGDNYHGGTPSLEGLELLRLDGCLGKPAGLHKALNKDIKKEGIKERYIKRIQESQMWWLTTIAMKVQMEGDNDKLKRFFDCNGTSLQDLMKMQSRHQRSTIDHRVLHEAKKLNEDIFRFYSKVFYRKSARKLDTQKAIKAGIVPLKFIQPDHKTIRSPFGGTVKIKGTRQGGIKVTYANVPQGEMCTEFVEELRDVSFGRNRYEGPDYVLVNDTKIATGHFLKSYIKKLCQQSKTNTITFVHYLVSKKYKYDRYVLNRIESIMGKYAKYYWANNNYRSLWVSSNHQHLLSISNGSVSYRSIDKIYAPLKLSKKLRYYRSWAIGNDGNVVIASKSKNSVKYTNGTITQLDIPIKDGLTPNKLIEQIRFIDNNQTILATASNNQIVILYDLQNNKLLAQFTPKLMEKAKEFNRKHTKIRAMALSPDHKTLYVVCSMYSSQAEIEQWELKSNDSNNKLSFAYIKTLPNLPKAPINAISINSNHPNTLVVGGNEDVMLYDLTNEKVSLALKSGSDNPYRRYSHVELSDDGKWVLGQRNSCVEVWKRQSPDYPFEVFKGQNNPLVALFMPHTHDLLIGSKQSIALHTTTDRYKILKKKISNSVIMHEINSSDNPVFVAVESNRIKVLKKLLDSGAVVNKKDNFYGFTPIYNAIVLQQDNMVKLLLDHGANINLPIKLGKNKFMTPYELLLLKVKNSKILKIVLDHGVDVNKKLPNTKSSPLGTVLLGCPNSVEPIKLLLKYGANPDKIAKMPQDKLMRALKHCKNKKVIKSAIKLIKKAAKKRHK